MHLAKVRHHKDENRVSDVLCACPCDCYIDTAHINLSLLKISRCPSSHIAEWPCNSEIIHTFRRVCLSELPELPNSPKGTLPSTPMLTALHYIKRALALKTISAMVVFAATVMSRPLSLRTCAPCAFTGNRPFSRIPGAHPSPHSDLSPS